jgi:dUTP pyrophosphatase
VIAPRVLLRVKKLDPNARLPVYMTGGAAGMDLAACLSEPLVIPPMEVRAVPTGIALEIPEGYEGQVRARSGLALRARVGLPNAPGTIDSDYRGPLQVLLINFGEENFVVRNGDRIAQLVIARVERAEIVEDGALTDTARGAGGFGHTGPAGDIEGSRGGA